MKIQLALTSALALILSACATSHPEQRVVTKGPLICAADEVCPEIAMRWNDEKRNGFKITAEIANPEQYDIKKFSFLIDGQPYEYSTLGATQYSAEAQNKISKNSIVVPVSFLNSFNNAKEIDLKLSTDKGDILRPVLKADGQKSSAYLTFLKGYTGQLVQ